MTKSNLLISVEVYLHLIHHLTVVALNVTAGFAESELVAEMNFVLLAVVVDLDLVVAVAVQASVLGWALVTSTG